MSKRYRIAMVLYAVLAVLAWFTLGDDSIVVMHKQVELRWFPLLLIGSFAFRTYLALKADKIRRGE
jgi:uncharacterized RDD family membrane protein YckC